jgi:hypothetical protein
VQALEASEVVLDELGDSADPVAEREVLDALVQKGDALSKLRRFAESVEVWDEVVNRCADGAPAGRTDAVIVALMEKAEALSAVGDDAAVLEVTDVLLSSCRELQPTLRVRRIRLRAMALKRDTLAATDLRSAATVDHEIVSELAEAIEPEFRRAVAFALSHQAWTLLRQDRVNDALLVSDRIIQRFLNEPQETLGAVAQAVVDHGGHLAKITGPGPVGVARFVAFAALNTADETLRSAIRAMQHLPIVGRASPIDTLGNVTGRFLPARVVLNRRRLAQAIIVSDTVISRLAVSDEPELQVVAAIARTAKVSSQIALGHVVAGFRAFDALSGSDQPGVVHAFQRLADQSGQSDTAVARVGEVSFLAHRARALGQGDSRIERIAYDDSLQARPSRENDPAFVRWFAARLRPRSKRRTAPYGTDPV